MRIREFTTNIGRKYQDLYIQIYKKAHRDARQQGMDSASADTYAQHELEKYKEKVRTGQWDPITRRKGTGRAEYK